jgi:hypothetical protein
LTDAAITALTDKGWGTLGTFAFCASNSPATVTDTVFAEKVVQPILGDRDHVDAPKLRRLHFEAYTTVSAELKRRVESSEQDAPRKLPPQEISERGFTKESVAIETGECSGTFSLLDQPCGTVCRRRSFAIFGVEPVHHPQPGGQQSEGGPVSESLET